MRKKESHLIEDISIRIMYFFNTMDSFLWFSIIIYFLLASVTGFKFLINFKSLLLLLLIGITLYIKLKLVDFFPTILIFIFIEFLFWEFFLETKFYLYLFKISLFFFIFTSFIQIIFMGFPMALAARSIVIPFRIYINSFFIISPTTLSLPLTIIYQTYIASISLVLSRKIENVYFICAYLVFSIISIIFSNKLRKRQFVPEKFLPKPVKKYYKRVILLNIDGLNYFAYKKSNAIFLKYLEENFASPKNGAHTIYRALTNPAFVSILTGTPSDVHKVTNNNVGQTIKVEALPDFIPTRLYGSMHVRHFSRREWNINVISLVKEGYQNADKIMIELLKKDILRHKDIKLWVIDFSEVDYCGHSWGSYSKHYTKAIENIDHLIKDFFKFLIKYKLIKDTFVIISSDHGLFIGEHSFLLSPKEEMVPLIFIGKTVPNLKFEFKISIMDINPNISFALGEKYCDATQGRVFESLFKFNRNDFIRIIKNGFINNGKITKV